VRFNQGFGEGGEGFGKGLKGCGKFRCRIRLGLVGFWRRLWIGFGRFCCKIKLELIGFWKKKI